MPINLIGKLGNKQRRGDCTGLPLELQPSSGLYILIECALSRRKQSVSEMPPEKKRSNEDRWHVERGSGQEQKMIVHLLHALNFNEAPITRRLHTATAKSLGTKSIELHPHSEKGLPLGHISISIFQCFSPFGPFFWE